ncbi:DUF389 domain-containing protein [Reichenbachiella agarivorans]|uniref:DUF389 domain-containing protein n=1 Tax=Reichenbachiella agarivorans TaxID=2979464 RepID=A0ABY6CTP4_9BACT|nr:DUF389 domain-containing protein [Reichenbachiella agarivorans]UXP33897.1 DUF389 domain-containing protein [Reichenbachiella agarivorans]
MENTRLKFLASLKSYLNELFDLKQDSERESTTVSEIRKGIVFRGANLWILIFAILIASIGLNVNSTAVIIGAMLISPLMGPIMGIGLGAGINDFELIKRAFMNLSVAVLISVSTSALYFAITPLHEAQSELLARTTPTLWDVLIALFGGLAGIIAGSRKEKSNAIPGVAIATALMPPLCTAGYGLANGNWYYFIGAFYLFFINSVFISVSTFLIVRFLKFRKNQFESPAIEKRVKTSILVFVIVTIIPSVYLAYNVVRGTIFEQNAKNFISSSFNMEQTQVISQRYFLDQDKEVIEVTLYGKPLDQTAIQYIREKMPLHGLHNGDLRIKQGYQEDLQEKTMKEFEKMGENLKFKIIEDMYAKSEEVIKTKDERIAFLENQVAKMHLHTYPIQDIEKELSVQYPALKSLALGELINHNMDTICYAFVDYKTKLYRSDRQKIEKWLQVRTKADSLIVVIQ